MALQDSTETSTGSVVRLGLAALTVWRVTSLIALEDGPFDVSARVRRRLGDGFFGKLSDCFACASVWVAAPVAALVRPRRVTDLLLTWLGLSAVAYLLQERFGSKVADLRYLDEEREANGLL